MMTTKLCRNEPCVWRPFDGSSLVFMFDYHLLSGRPPFIHVEVYREHGQGNDTKLYKIADYQQLGWPESFGSVYRFYRENVETGRVSMLTKASLVADPGPFPRPDVAKRSAAALVADTDPARRPEVPMPSTGYLVDYTGPTRQVEVATSGASVVNKPLLVVLAVVALALYALGGK